MSTIPLFPEFKNIEPSDREEVLKITSQFPPYSDFDFTSLWTWNTSKGRQLSMLNNNLVVKFTDYTTNEPFISFLGINKTNETVRTLLKYCESVKLPTTLSLVPESSVIDLDDSEFNIFEDRGNNDYIYSVADHTVFEGSDYHPKRRRVNKFARENPLARVITENLNGNKDIQSDIFAVISAWEKNKVREAKEYELEHELSAINCLFTESELSNVVATCVYADALMIAFSIDETFPDSEYVVSHFAKYDSLYPGVYEFLVQNRAKYFVNLGKKFINCEQDLDIAGLRQSKESYLPCKYLKKFKVSAVRN